MYDQPEGGGQPPSLPERNSGEKTLWEKAQDQYYAFCDALQDHGIPVYDFFVYPLEDRGIPSLPAFIIIILALLLGVGWLAFGGISLEPQSYSLKASVYGESGPIEGAVLSLSQADSLLSKAKSEADGSASFEGLAAGVYSLEVEKEGFQKAVLAISLPRDSNLDITLVSSSPITFSGGTQPNGNNVNNGDFPNMDFPSSLSLKIFVTDIAGNPLDATASVFDNTAGTKIGTVFVRQGFGSLEGLEEGMVVYADVAAEGHVAYLGKNDAITISAESPNSISVQLFKITNGTETSVVKVKDAGGNALEGVLIKAFRRGSPFALTIANQYTNSNGELSIALNSSGNPDFKVLASKAGFVDKESEWFKAGQNVEMTLKREGELNQSEKDKAANLTLTVTFNGTAVANAAVAVFHPELATREGFTNARGKISFYILESRGLTVTANASKNNLFASQQVSLDSAQVEAELQLERRKAGVVVRAFNNSNSALIENAVFDAKVGGQSVSSCAVAAPNFDCVLRIGIGYTAEITASAPTFISEEKTLVVNNASMRLDFSLIPEYAVQSSLIKDFVVTPEGSNSNVTTLYPGRRYEAKFTLIGKTNSTGDEFGFYFAVDSARAVIKRITPPAPPSKTLGSATAACNPQQIDYNNANAAWIDLTYNGGNSPVSKSVKVVFEIKPLGQGVQEANMTVRYRSFLVQGGKYYRNPLNINDPPETRFEPKTPLASGCNSPTFNAAFAINGVGITCSDYACISVLFTQNGQASAKDNFTMNNRGLNATPPVVLLYEIALKKNVAALPNDVAFSFDAPGGFIGLLSVAYPDEPDAQGTPPQPPNKVVFLNGTPASLVLDLTHLKRYSNMDAGFRFAGEFVIKPLSEFDAINKQLFVQISQGSESARHAATYHVDANLTIGGGGQTNNTLNLLPPSPDSCGGSPTVIFRPENLNQVLLKPRFDFPIQCGTIDLRVTPLFPADAIPIEVNISSPVLVAVQQDDGSSICFESCRLDSNGNVNENSCTRDFSAFTSSGKNALRYNPEKFSQCSGFKVAGNEIKGAFLTLKLDRVGGSENPAFFKINVSNEEAFEAPSLFLSPILTSVSGSGSTAPQVLSVAYPQLWAVTNLKQVGPRDLQLYLANPSNIQQPVANLPPVSFTAPGTQTFVLNPSPASLVLVAKENGKIIFIQNNATSKIKPVSEYSKEFVAMKYPNSYLEIKPFAESNVGFDTDTLSLLSAKALQKARETALWRSEGSAWCLNSTACYNNNYRPFESCCKATREEWLRPIVSFENSTVSCSLSDGSPAKFCNNLGYPQESGNWDEQTQSCALPIDFGTQGFPHCDGNFNPSTQAYCDSRCAATVVGGTEENPDIQMAAQVFYNESYKDSFEATPAVCSADEILLSAQMNASYLPDCIARGLCPIVNSLINGITTPACVTQGFAQANGLLNTGADNFDEISQNWEYATFNDGGTSNETSDDYWECSGGKVFAVLDYCQKVGCNSYCSSSGVAGAAERCDESGLCDRDGTKVVQTIVYQEQNLTAPLVEIPFASFNATRAASPMALFPSVFTRGFLYSLPVNTMVLPSNYSSVLAAFATLGLSAPTSCNTPGNFTFKGLFDLQAKLEFDQNARSSFLSKTLSVLTINRDSYSNTPCASAPVAMDACNLLFTANSSADACIKSIAQFDYFSEAPPTANGVAGVPLSQMEYAGRLGNFYGEKKFAITHTGFIVALRKGWTGSKLFDWWRPDGSYGGNFKVGTYRYNHGCYFDSYYGSYSYAPFTYFPTLYKPHFFPIFINPEIRSPTYAGAAFVGMLLNDFKYTLTGQGYDFPTRWRTGRCKKVGFPDASAKIVLYVPRSKWFWIVDWRP